MESTESCVLGKFSLVRRDHFLRELKARDVYKTDFVPSKQCIELMQQVADGIRGIAAIVETCERDTTFAIVFDDGINPDEATNLWIPAFRRATRRVRPEKRKQLVCGSSFVPPDPYREMVELYSDERYSPADS